MTNVAVFASGSGTTLQAILDAFATPRGSEHVRIAVVVSNNPAAYALERARRAGVPTVLADHRGRSREAFEADLAAAVDAHRADLICLAGFLRILSPAFVARYAGRILNTHPALLPAFGGKGMYGDRVHRAVLAAGSPTSGCTIHVVDEVPDGGPIVAQAAVPVLDGDTPASLAERVQTEERRLYPDAIRWWADGRIQIYGQSVVLRPASPEGHPAGEPAARP
ncbi:MAG: phosphoribosylglycinamide formyltransferase [Armatimonadota bacterium]